MSFATLKRAILANLLLNPNLHGERGRFELPDGTEVLASVHVDASGMRDKNEATADQVDRLKVLVNRDPEQAATLDAAGNEIGCISHAQPGLRFYRAGDDEPFTWTGGIEGQRDYKWRLVFERRRRIRQGMRQ